MRMLALEGKVAPQCPTDEFIGRELLPRFSVLRTTNAIQLVKKKFVKRNTKSGFVLVKSWTMTKKM